MLKSLAAAICVLCGLIAAFGQDDLRKVIDTEHAFANLAASQGTKAAFLANMADDALVFLPEKTVAKPFWSGRPDSKSLLSWAPNYAEVSSNGILGYTTGNWEFRPNGKDDAPTAFGEFITIWLRQPGGDYKFVVDIGVGHAKPATYSTEWATSGEKIKDANAKNTSPADIANGFFQTAGENGLAKAYSIFAADEIRLYRESKSPIFGKKAVISSLKRNKAAISFAKKSTFFGAGDLSYSLGTYTMRDGDKISEQGNSMQIWRLIRGKWQIVLDILKPVPAK